jgi:glycosyltransferase involved in cell wall biosynthesis
MRLRVSVVIATYRRRHLLEKCLASLASQEFPAAGFEVIIADDEASPETEALVYHWAANTLLNLRYLPVSATVGPAAARNAGWQAAESPIIAFTDDDCMPDPQWLCRALAAFQPGVDAVWGRLVMPVPHPPRDYQRNASCIEHAEFVTANCFCRRHVLKATGGFDPQFTAAWREDSDLYFTLLEHGYNVVHQPQAVVLHPVRGAFWGVSLVQQKNSLFNALLYKKHPGLYRQRIQSQPPYRYYYMVFALLFAAAASLAGARPLLLLSLIIWTVFYARFCGSRLSGTSRAPDHIVEMLVTSAFIPPLAIFWRLTGAVRYRVLFL